MQNPPLDAIVPLLMQKSPGWQLFVEHFLRYDRPKTQTLPRREVWLLVRQLKKYSVNLLAKKEQVGPLNLYNKPFGAATWTTGLIAQRRFYGRLQGMLLSGSWVPTNF